MKKMVLVLSLALVSTSIFAQESTSKVSYKTNGLWDNWFVNFGGGGSMYFGDTQSSEADILERVTWGATASVGKWVTPVIGGRLTFQGGAKHTFNDRIGRDAASNPGHKMASGHYMSAHVDALVNLSNWIAGYKENRVWNFIPYMGVGIAMDDVHGGGDHVWKYSTTPVGVVGFLNTFKVSKSKNIAITLDISGQAVQSKFNDARFDTRPHHDKSNRTTNGYDRQDWDGIGSAMLGISFGLGGKQNFDRADEVTVVDNTDPILLANLQNQIDNLNAENADLRNQLKNQKPTTTTTTLVAKNVPNPVQFELNKAVIEPKQEAVIYNVAQYLKDNPDTSVRIEGYADKQTGTAAINKALSKKRAEAVENRLIKDYGISKKRIISAWKGDTVQPYPVNDWNRVVVITVVD